MKNEDIFKYFVMFFLRYENILFTRINFDEMEKVGTSMVSLMRTYTRYLKGELPSLDPKGAGVNHKKEFSSLSFIAVLIIFSLDEALHGMSTMSASNVP
jgi:uncharacterized protein YbbC (DUF1343 family)